MANVQTTEVAASDLLREDPAGQAAVNAIREYASLPLFRSAQFSELVIEDNPYRRPLRPEDLEWLRFGEPLTAPNAAQLSGLLAHRMLLSIYDGDRTLVPKSFSETTWKDFDEFYASRTRAAGELIRPLLEDHVFGYVKQAALEAAAIGEEGVPGVTRLLTTLATQFERRAAELRKVRDLARHSDRIARTHAIQLVGQRLLSSMRLIGADDRSASIAVGTFDGSFAGGVAFGQSMKFDRALQDLTVRYDLGWSPHQYFQFYLPTTLALMNYISMRRSEPTDILRLAGALTASTLATDFLIDADIELTIRWIVSQVVEPMWRQGGSRMASEFAAGAMEYSSLLEAHHVDLVTQLRWIDASTAYARKAHRLQNAITTHRLSVELDTFIETSKECSTAHVHDDDRLVVIESGQMEFWNCFGEIHKFSTGDAMFVPRHRLHGSVVTSGTCVYHQPVITSEINSQYG